jgi:putative lipoic acid-binding regulatory protein
LYVTTWFENTVWWFEKVDMIKIMFPTQFDHVKIFGIMQDSQADSFVEVLALVRHIGWTVP